MMARKRQPNAFERMVEHVTTRIAPRGKAVVHCEDARMLLRRYHAKVVKLITQQIVSGIHDSEDCIDRYRLLAALAALRKGRP